MWLIMNKKQIGKLGEDIACNYLKSNNYKIIKRNFYCRRGEIDIIVNDIKTKELVFIEVKCRNNIKFGSAIESINKRKIIHIMDSAQYYLYKNRLNISIRFDAIEVYIKEKKIKHIKQII